ncbi:MAG: peptidylprolyl isomerase, partial [Burkholderiales bacterium]|nr:peptidylprolyl isomerase [Burkholderiales bacterium]
DTNGRYLTAVYNGGTGGDPKLTFTAAATGTYYVSASDLYDTGTGTYTLKATSKGAVTDDFAGSTLTRGTVSVGGSITGSLEFVGDQDWFAVTLAAGQQYVINLDATTTGGLSDPYLSIYNGSGVLLTTDDDNGPGLGSLITYRADTSGTYYLAASSGTFGTKTGGYTVSVKAVVDDYAANSTTTGRVVVGSSSVGKIEDNGDKDWLAVTLVAGQNYVINLDPSTTGGLSDPYLTLYNASGVLLTTDDDSGPGLGSLITYRADTSGTYYIAASSGTYGTKTGGYTVSVKALVDDYAASMSTTGVITIGSQVTGSIEIANDEDWFKVSLQAGSSYTIELLGEGGGGGTLPSGLGHQPYLRLFDTNGRYLTAVFNGGTGDDPKLTFTAAATGTYYVSASDLYDTGTGTYTIKATSLGAITDDYAGSALTRGTVSIGGSITGSLELAGDQDWFAVTLTAGQQYVINLDPSTTGGLSDPYLTLYNASGVLLTTDDDNGPGLGSLITYRADTSGTYYLAASSGTFGTKTGGYTLAVKVLADTTVPTVTFTDNITGTANLATGNVTYSLTFSESVTGLAANDLTVTNGTVSSVSGSGTSWSVIVTPTSGVASSTIGLTLKAGAVSDLAGNLNAVALNSSQAIDTVAPVSPKLVTHSGFKYLVNPQITMQTNMGQVLLQLYPEQAPITVANMLAYANSGFYDGTLFHRVIDGFMIQGGGFNSGLAYKTPTYSAIALESNNGLLNVRGTIAMARTVVFDSATTQFFVNQVDNTHLDYSNSISPGYAVFGKVLSGMEVIDSIAKVPNATVGSYSNVPITNVTITSLQQTIAGSSITKSGILTVSGLEAGAQWSFSLNSGSTWTAGTGNTLSLPDGSYAANAIQIRQTDAAGNVSVTAGKLSSALLVDTTAPKVTAFSPADEAKSVAVGANIVITFNETVQVGTGNIFLKTSAGETVATYNAANSANLSISGNTLTIDPTANLNYNTAYKVEIAAGSIKDIAGNLFNGVSDYDFSTAEIPAPTTSFGGHAYHWKNHALMQGVEISNGSSSVTTDALGQFQLASSSGTPEILSPTLVAQSLGSAISSADALAALKIAVGRNPNLDGSPISPYQYIAADVNGDGTVTSADALAILKMAVKRTDALPVKWLFVKESEDFWDEALKTFTTTRKSVVWDQSIDAVNGQNNNIVAVLKGDVNGSWAAPSTAQNLDVLNPNYFTDLSTRLGTPKSQWGVGV